MATHTLESVEASLLDYSDFEEVGSVSRAKSLITAANRWLVLSPQSSSNAGSSLSFDTDGVKELRRRAQQYVAANATTNGASDSVRHLSICEDFR